MFISRLKLVNFEGIRQGLDRDVFEINFSRDNKITMLSGANGSGKSTILSQLHPYKESFDERKSLISDGKEGRKEIDIYKDKDFYEIVHIYASTAKSFFKKNGEELNPNGGVKTCEDLITTELGITKDYFNIGRIGSNTRNFIEFSTAERKNYISTFLNMEELGAAFKVVKEKVNVLKKDITAISAEVNSYPEENTVTEKISALEKDILEITDNLAALYQNKGSYQTNIETDQNNLAKYDLINLPNEISSKIREKDSSQKIIESFETLYDPMDELEIEKSIEDCSKDHSDVLQETAGLISDKQNKEIILADYKNKLSVSNIELAALGNPEDLEKLIEEIRIEKIQMTKIKEKIVNNPYARIVSDMNSKKENIHNALSNVVDLLEFIESNCNKINSDYFTRKDSVYSFLKTIKDPNQFLEDEVRTVDTLIRSQKDLRGALEKEAAINESYINRLDKLKDRPKTCTDNSCPFIKDLYDHRDAAEQFAKCTEKIENVKKSIIEAESKRDTLLEYVEMHKNFVYYLGKVSGNPLYEKIILDNISLDDLIKNATTPKMSSLKDDIKAYVNDALTDLSDYMNTTTKIKSLEKSKEAIENADSGLKEKYEKDIAEASSQIVNIQAAISILNQNILDSNNRAASFSDKLVQLKKYKAAKISMKNIDSEIVSLNNDYEKAKSLEADLRSAQKLFQEIQSDIDKAVTLRNSKLNTKTTAEVQLKQIQTLHEKINKMEKEYQPLSTVFSALSPSSGIPLILIQLYLERTQIITNELLNLAYDGDFEINFKTSAKDFFIQVRSKENVKNDIKLASQGEMALTAISLSLALIEQSIGEYNILCLDEIDGPLDKKNRSKFIEILNSQIEKLDLEQVFVISHNDAFDSCEMNLILLKGSPIDTTNSGIMENKKVLFDISE